MALNTKVLTLTQPGATGNQTYNLAAGFDPKAVIVWATPLTADGTIAHANYSHGFGTYRGSAVQQAYANIRHQDASTTADSAGGTGDDAICKLYSATTPTVDLEIDLVSMTNSGTPNVVLNWVNLHTTASIRVFMMVLGGSDITDAYVDKLQSGGVTAVNETVVAGFGKPDTLFFLHGRGVSGNGDGTGDGRLGWGMFHNDAGTFDQCGWSYRLTDANTASIISCEYRVNRCLVGADSNGTGGAHMGYLPADSGGSAWPTDGFRVEWSPTQAGVPADRMFHYLALKGTYQAKIHTGGSSLTSGSSHDFAVGFQAKSSLHYSVGINASTSATNTSASGLLSYGMGASDGTDERWAGFTDNDAAGTMFADSQQSITKSIVNWGTHAAGGPTKTSEADVSYLTTDVRFTWTTLDSVFRAFCFIAFGDAPTSGTDYEEFPADSVTMSDAVIFDMIKAAADSVTMSDARAYDFGKALADTVGLADNTSTAKDVPLAPADSVTMSDNADTAKGKSVEPADSVTMSDAQTYERGLGAADSVSMADNLARIMDMARQHDDSVTMGDNLASAKVIPLAPADSVTMSDNQALVKGLFRDFADSVTPSDAIAFTRDAAHADSVGLADAVVFSREILLSDSATMTDLVVFAREVLFGDTLGLSDLADPINSGGGGTGHTVNPEDSVSMSDNMVFVVDHAFSVDDTLPLTDSTAFSRAVVLQDPLGLADALALSWGLSAADVLAIADLATPDLDNTDDWTVNVDDSVTVADALSFIRGIVRSDTVAMSDAHQRHLNGVLLDDGEVAVVRQGIIYIGRF